MTFKLKTDTENTKLFARAARLEEDFQTCLERIPGILESAAGSLSAEKAEAEFLPEEASREEYLVIRDALRDSLRIAGEMQRARRIAERSLPASEEWADKRAIMARSRMMDRPMITALIRVRRAGKIWSANARAKRMAQVAA